MGSIVFYLFFAQDHNGLINYMILVCFDLLLLPVIPAVNKVNMARVAMVNMVTIVRDHLPRRFFRAKRIGNGSPRDLAYAGVSRSGCR